MPASVFRFNDHLSIRVFGFCTVLASSTFLVLAWISTEDLKDGWVLYGFLGLFWMLGLASLGAVKRIVIDTTNRVAKRERGVFMLLKSTTYDLRSVKYVSIHQELKRGSSDSRSKGYWIYPVRLERDQKLTLSQSRDVVTARRDAERVAKMLILSVEDRTGGKVLRRDYQELDKSVQQRLRDEGVSFPGVVEQPEGSRIGVVDREQSREFWLPPRAPLKWDLGFIFSFFFGVWSLGNDSLDSASGIFIGVVETLGPYSHWWVMAVAVCLWMGLSRSRDVITVDDNNIDIDKRAPVVRFKVRPTRGFPVLDLEEFIAEGIDEQDENPESEGKNPADHLTAKIRNKLETRRLIFISDDARVSIPNKLTRDDLRFLNDSILSRIAL